MYEPPEATRHHDLLKLSILLPVRANLLCNLQCETPCINLLWDSVLDPTNIARLNKELEKLETKFILDSRNFI